MKIMFIEKSIQQRYDQT